MKKLIVLALAGVVTLGSVTGCKKSAPNVIGLDRNAATLKIQASGLNVGQVCLEYAGPDKAPGTVVRQDPGPGVKLSGGETVNLVLEHSLIVPKIVGQEYTKAIGLLESLGFTVEPIVTVYEGQKPLGTVLTQSPPANLRVATNTTVQLVIEYYATVTNFVGKPLEEVIASMQALGLVLGKTDPPKKASKNPQGTVVSQSVKAGTKVALGSAIDLEVVPPPEDLNSDKSSGQSRLWAFVTRLAERAAERAIDKGLGSDPNPPRQPGTTPSPAPPGTKPVVPPTATPPASVTKPPGIDPRILTKPVIPRTTFTPAIVQPAPPIKVPTLR